MLKCYCLEIPILPVLGLLLLAVLLVQDVSSTTVSATCWCSTDSCSATINAIPPPSSVDQPQSPNYCPICHDALGPDQGLMEQHFARCQQRQQQDQGFQQQQYISTHITSTQQAYHQPFIQQQQQDVFEDQHAHGDQYYEEEEDNQEEYYPYDQTFDIASDDVRIARGLVFAALQVEWSNKIVAESNVNIPIFTARETQKEVLPSGLPTSWYYTDHQLAYLIGNISYENLNNCENDNEIDMSEIQQIRTKNRTRVINSQRRVKPLQKKVTISDTIQIATSSGTITRQVTASAAPVSNTVEQTPPQNSKMLEDLLKQLNLKGKTRMGDLTPKDIEEIRNNTNVPSGFKHSLIKAHQSGKINKMQLISDLKTYLQSKKNERTRSKSSTSSETGSI